MKKTVTEMNALQAINSRIGEAEDQMNNLEDKKAETTQLGQQNSKIKPKINK